jgi:phage head maturation protease
MLTDAELNNLPDSAFALVEDGGTKDAEGKTVPRSLRHYAIHDTAHVANALSRAAAAVNVGGHTAEIAHRAMPAINAAAKKMGVGAPAHRAMMDMPTDATSMRAHLVATEPAGHGLQNDDLADMPMATMVQAHAAAHTSGADHAHAGAPTGRSEQPPRDFLVRALAPTFTYEDGESVRAVDFTPSPDPTTGIGDLMGRFAVFDTWTEVRSVLEGHFMERTGGGAFRDTLAKSRPPIIFNHGWDPQIGTKPLAPTEQIGEDTRGGYYGGPLLDTSYNRDLVPGLRANLYGSSYRFRTTKQDFVPRPKTSDYNPQGLPEMTVREAALREVGPGMFPVYTGTSATVRSQTDDYLLSRFGDPDQLRAFISAQSGAFALPNTGAGDSPSDEGSDLSTRPPTPPAIAAIHPSRFRSRDEWLTYLKERPHR